MISRIFNVISQKLMIAFAGLTVMLMLPISIYAQVGPPPRIDNPDPSAEMRERRNREAALRSAEIIPGKSKDDPQRAEAMAKQISEDFRNLQVIRNKMVRALKTDKPLDYKKLVNETGEVYKRASRLKAIMALNNNEADKTQVTQFALDEGQMKNALIKLCNGIITFTESSVFKTPGVSDVKEAAKARRDLQNIIDLSNGIKKSAEALSKRG